MFAFNDKTVVLFCSNGRQYAFAVESGRLKSSFGPSKDGEYALRPDQDVRQLMLFLPDNRFLSPGLSYENRETLYVRNFSAAETMASLKHHTGAIDLVVTNIDQSLAASVSNKDDGELYVWDINKYKVVTHCNLSGHCNMVAFCANQDDLLLTENGSAITVWYIGTRSTPVEPAVALKTFYVSEKMIYTEVIPSRSLLLTASVDNVIRIWNLQEVADKAHALVNKHGAKLPEYLEEQGRIQQRTPSKSNEGCFMTTATAISRFA